MIPWKRWSGDPVGTSDFSTADVFNLALTKTPFTHILLKFMAQIISARNRGKNC